MPDRIRHRPLRRLGGVPAVDVDAHAHLGDTTNASHFIFLWLVGWLRVSAISDGDTSTVDLFGLSPRYTLRHCERSEAIQTAAAVRPWIASLRSQ